MEKEKIDNIDLSQENFKTVEKFFTDIFLRDKKSQYVFTTGEYGMLLFHIMIYKELKDKDFVQTVFTNIRPMKIDEEIGEQYVVYELSNGENIKIKHDPELDKEENIDERTGYPKKASILYYERKD